MMPCEVENATADDQLNCCIDFACKGKADDDDCIKKRCGFYKNMAGDKSPTTTTVAGPTEAENYTTTAGAA